MEVIEIIQPGIHASIQDNGRFGQRNFAIPQSGCLDQVSAYLANHLVGNSYEKAVIEIVGGRFEGLILEAVSLAVVGAGVTVWLNQKLISNQRTIQAKKEDIIKIESHGLSYLAVSSGLKGQQNFRSISTYAMAGLGGLDGDILKGGDRARAHFVIQNNTSELPEQVMPKTSADPLIRIVKGPEQDRLLITDREFEVRKWRISPKSDRMGIRLEGEALQSKQSEMNSVPTFPGTIQLTNEGLPIILMNDAQTTGGYPRIGQVVQADLPRLARMILGGTIRFKFVDISEARYILTKKEAFLKHGLD